jgi:CHAT domain-containing protein
MVAALLALPMQAWTADRPDEMTPAQRQEVEKKVADRNQETMRLYRDGDYVKALETCRELLELRRALYPKAQYPQGHIDIIGTVTLVATFHKHAGEFGKAEPLHLEALNMARALFAREDSPLARMVIAARIDDLANMYVETGEYGKAEPLLRESLAQARRQFSREKYPKGHRDLAIVISSLGVLYGHVGEYGLAEAHFQEALDMQRALYPTNPFPDRHLNLFSALNNLATLQAILGEYDKAEPLHKEAQELLRAKFPQGHPELAASLHNLAGMYRRAGKYDKALSVARESVATGRNLFPTEKYPLGHRYLAGSLLVLGGLLQETSEYDQAETVLHESLAMHRALYPTAQFPQGHPSLALSLDGLGALRRAGRQYDRAEPLFQEALAMNRGLALRYADLLAEARALNYIASQPHSRDALLSASRHLPRAAVYDALWDSRAALTRLLERRHRDLMASRDPETAGLADQLRRARSDLAGRLLSPLRDPDKQRAAVQQLTDAKEELETRIAARLKLAPRGAAPAATPKQLARTLSPGTALIDLYRYKDWEQDPEITGAKGEKRTLRYVAFVVLPGQSAVRVELQEAAPIDRAWAAWRQAIVAARTDFGVEREAARRFGELAWQPIRAVLPADLKTLYLVPDGELHQVPWGALPGKMPDTVLLDECALCLVPHGPFLLERLQARSGAGAGGTLLAYGGIDYEGDPAAVIRHEDVRGPLLREKRVHWGALPGTALEQQQVVALAKKALKADPISRSGRRAGTRQLEEDLPRARYAHLATHGFFAGPEFRNAIEADPKQFERSSTDIRGGARSPLVLSGLVLAGANRPAREPEGDRGIITAEGLIALRMEGLELAVLSACETGLGAYGGGEGVYGLQRAFHVAGCKNVVASLWKVSDEATQALMVLFYRNLWEKKLDAAEALRQAQLALYRHPNAVAVALERGVDFSESNLPKVEDRPAERAQRSPTAHWAAFTFSGVRPADGK